VEVEEDLTQAHLEKQPLNGSSSSSSSHGIANYRCIQVVRMNRIVRMSKIIPKISWCRRCGLSAAKWVVGLHSAGRVWYLQLPCF